MKTRYIVAALIMVFLIILATTACNRARGDAQVTNDVQAKIFADKSVQSRQIAVQSSNGVVTLSGYVGSDAERMAAANDAAQVEGVRTVVNNLQASAPTVATTQPEPQPIVQETAKPQASEPRRVSHERSYGSSRTKTSTEDTEAMNKPDPAPAPAPTPVAAVPTTPPPPPAPVKVTVPDGTMLSIRMIDSVDTTTAEPGQVFRASLDSPVTVDDNVVIPAHADIEGRVVESKSAGRFTGKSELAVELFKLSYNGKTYTIHTNQYSHAGSSRGKTTATRVGTGAAIGAIIGGIAGGGKGAAIGATVGAGAGGGATAIHKGEQVKLASEQVLTFTLQSPLTVTPASAVNRNPEHRQLSAEE